MIRILIVYWLVYDYVLITGFSGKHRILDGIQRNFFKSLKTDSKRFQMVQRYRSISLNTWPKILRHVEGYIFTIWNSLESLLRLSKKFRGMFRRRFPFWKQFHPLKRKMLLLIFLSIMVMLSTRKPCVKCYVVLKLYFMYKNIIRRCGTKQPWELSDLSLKNTTDEYIMKSAQLLKMWRLHRIFYCYMHGVSNSHTVHTQILAHPIVSARPPLSY